MEYDVEKVMVTNERQAGMITDQRRELNRSQSLIAQLKKENESFRNTIGVLRFRLWERKNGIDETPGAEVMSRHGWSDDHADYRAIVVRIAREKTP